MRLMHDFEYVDAVSMRCRVAVVQDGEIMGYGDIVDFDGKLITIVDAEDGSTVHYFRSNCQFYAEKEPIL